MSSRLLPQLELGPRVGGLKVLFQRSGIVTRVITMLSAMSAAWSTSGVLRDVFLGSYVFFVAAAAVAVAVWMLVDYAVILPSEQTFRMGQAHREERSPLKQDHERILRELRDE